MICFQMLMIILTVPEYIMYFQMLTLRTPDLTHSLKTVQNVAAKRTEP